MFGTNDTAAKTTDDAATLDNLKQLMDTSADPAVATTAPATPEPTTPASSPFTATAVTSAAATQDDPTPAVPATDKHKAEPAEGFSSSPAPTSQKTPEVPFIPTTDTVNDREATAVEDPTDEPQVQSASAPIADDDQTNGKSDPVVETTVPAAPDQNQLADLKQQALEHLEPLADHVGGTPEETFKTTMMMIQANDNHTLLEKALNAAKNIEDDKTRAQAMLDVINEINYFSQESQEV